jgi:hypothetical protein
VEVVLLWEVIQTAILVVMELVVVRVDIPALVQVLRLESFLVAVVVQ